MGNIVSEEWRSIKEYDDYEVSSLGRIRNKKTNNILKGLDNGLGYKRVSLAHPTKKKKFMYIHRIVADAFIPNKSNKPCINHIDNNPNNNAVDNLEWCTHQENTDWMIKQGRNKRTKKWLDRLHKTQEKQKKPVISVNINTGEIKKYSGVNDVRKYGFDPSCVCYCCKGKRKKHKGYYWRYL